MKISRIIISFLIINSAGIFPLTAHANADEKGMFSDVTSALSEIKNTFNEIKETFAGIGRFFKNISIVTGTIARYVDPRAVLLLFWVLFFSAGFAAIGIPRGKTSFIISLISVDALWILWEKSMNPENWSIAMFVRVNLILLLPYFIFFALRKIVPVLYKKASIAITSRWKVPFLSPIKEKEEAVFLAGQFKDTSEKFLNSLDKDVAGDNCKTVALSGTTRRYMFEIEKIIHRIYK